MHAKGLCCKRGVSQICFFSKELQSSSDFSLKRPRLVGLNVSSLQQDVLSLPSSPLYVFIDAKKASKFNREAVVNICESTNRVAIKQDESKST